MVDDLGFMMGFELSAERRGFQSSIINRKS